MMKCRLCKECNGNACAGEIPGLGGKGKGLSFKRNYSKLQEITLNLDLISEVDTVNTNTKLFGQEVSMPIYVAPIAGIKANYGVDISDYDHIKEMLTATKELNTITFMGDGIDIKNNFIDMINLANSVNTLAIPTMKPWVKEGIDVRLDSINSKNYFAMCMDIDSCGLPLLKNNAIKVEHKTVARLKEFKSRIDKPFIVKGIMTKEGALKAIEAGCDAIVVSNHGGRVLDSSTSTIEVLGAIAKVCKGKTTVLVDGGFRSGYDVFKALALGADGVLIGRPVACECVLKGSQGVIDYFHKLNDELKDAMNMCGFSNIKDININSINCNY